MMTTQHKLIVLAMIAMGYVGMVGFFQLVGALLKTSI